MDSLESQVESIEPKKTSLFNSVYSSVKKGVGKAVITGLALATLYSPMAYAAPQNSGVDTDRDGLSDSYELANGPTDPNNPSSSNSWEFNDNLGITDANIIPSFGFGFSAFNYHEITPAVTPEKDKNDFALSVSRDNRTIYFIRAKGDGAKPVLYMVERGKPGSAVKLTVEGDLGEFYDYQSGTPNFDDSGVILCTRDTGLSSGGKLVEVLKTGSVKDFLVFSDGRKALDPYIHRYGGTTGDILFVSVKESISNPNCVINAYPIVSGLPNASDERKIVSNMGKILRWPVVRGDGKVLAGTKIVSATQFIAGFFGDHAPYTENLEEKVINNVPFDFSEVLGFGNGHGAMFVGFLGQRYIDCRDFMEEKFDIVANNLAESDFDIRIHSPPANSLIKYVGNQFMPRVSSDGIIVFSDDTDGDGFLELYNASLESKVVHQHPDGHVPDDLDLVWYDSAGCKNKIARGTAITTPGSEKTLTVAPAIPLKDIFSLPNDTFMTYVKHSPSGTTFSNPDKSGSEPFSREAILNKFILEKEGLTSDNVKVYDVTINDVTGAIVPGTELKIASRTADTVTYTRSGFSAEGISVSRAPLKIKWGRFGCIGIHD